MNHLNPFIPYKHKKKDHEDVLTRALLTVLRLVPHAHTVFLDLVRRNRQLNDPELPPLWDMTSGEEPVVETQKANIEHGAGRLISVLLTDERPDQPIPVTSRERKAVYDGIIAYPPDWVLIIENKPRHQDIRVEQLSPGLGEESGIETVEPFAVIIEWKDVIGELNALLKNALVSGTAARVLEDFQDYVHSNFPFLNPYDSLAICRSQLDLLNRRCRDIMEKITPGRVKYHKGWKYYMYFPGEAAQQVALDAQGSEKHWELALSISPGDTMNQAKLLYDRLDMKQLLALQKRGWEVRPNFHLAFLKSNLMWGQTSMSVGKYARLWRKEHERLRQLPISDKDDFRKTVNGWRRTSLISQKDVAEIHAKFTNTNRKSVNVCPGLKLSYMWSSQDAVDLDNAGELVDDVRDKVKQAFRTWAQHFE